MPAVASAKLDKIRIQQTLIRLGREASYFAVSYDPQTDEPADVLTSYENVRPASVAANEVSARFETDPRHSRGLVLQREVWEWRLIVAFDVEVTSYAAEEEWSKDLPFLLPDSSAGLRRTTLVLTGVSYMHPPRQEPSGGSKIEFVFQARMGRR